jgi:hypothetical protein
MASSASSSSSSKFLPPSDVTAAYARLLKQSTERTSNQIDVVSRATTSLKVKATQLQSTVEKHNTKFMKISGTQLRHEQEIEDIKTKQARQEAQIASLPLTSSRSSSSSSSSSALSATIDSLKSGQYHLQGHIEAQRHKTSQQAEQIGSLRESMHSRTVLVQAVALAEERHDTEIRHMQEQVRNLESSSSSYLPRSFVPQMEAVRERDLLLTSRSLQLVQAQSQAAHAHVQVQMQSLADSSQNSFHTLARSSHVLQAQVAQTQAHAHSLQQQINDIGYEQRQHTASVQQQVQQLSEQLDRQQQQYQQQLHRYQQQQYIYQQAYAAQWYNRYAASVPKRPHSPPSAHEQPKPKRLRRPGKKLMRQIKQEQEQQQPQQSQPSCPLRSGVNKAISTSSYSSFDPSFVPLPIINNAACLKETGLSAASEKLYGGITTLTTGMRTLPRLQKVPRCYSLTEVTDDHFFPQAFVPSAAVLAPSGSHTEVHNMYTSLNSADDQENKEETQGAEARWPPSPSSQPTATPLQPAGVGVTRTLVCPAFPPCSAPSHDICKHPALLPLLLPTHRDASSFNVHEVNNDGNCLFYAAILSQASEREYYGPLVPDLFLPVDETKRRQLVKSALDLRQAAARTCKDNAAIWNSIPLTSLLGGELQTEVWDSREEWCTLLGSAGVHADEYLLRGLAVFLKRPIMTYFNPNHQGIFDLSILKELEYTFEYGPDCTAAWIQSQEPLFLYKSKVHYTLLLPQFPLHPVAPACPPTRSRNVDPSLSRPTLPLQLTRSNSSPATDSEGFTLVGAKHHKTKHHSNTIDTAASMHVQQGSQPLASPSRPLTLHVSQLQAAELFNTPAAAVPFSLTAAARGDDEDSSSASPTYSTTSRMSSSELDRVERLIRSSSRMDTEDIHSIRRTRRQKRPIMPSPTGSKCRIAFVPVSLASNHINRKVMIKRYYYALVQTAQHNNIRELVKPLSDSTRCTLLSPKNQSGIWKYAFKIKLEFESEEEAQAHEAAVKAIGVIKKKNGEAGATLSISRELVQFSQFQIGPFSGAATESSLTREIIKHLKPEDIHSHERVPIHIDVAINYDYHSGVSNSNANVMISRAHVYALLAAAASQKRGGHRHEWRVCPIIPNKNIVCTHCNCTFLRSENHPLAHTSSTCPNRKTCAGCGLFSDEPSTIATHADGRCPALASGQTITCQLCKKNGHSASTANASFNRKWIVNILLLCRNLFLPELQIPQPQLPP